MENRLKIKKKESYKNVTSEENAIRNYYEYFFPISSYFRFHTSVL